LAKDRNPAGQPTLTPRSYTKRRNSISLVGGFMSHFGGTAGFYARYRPPYPEAVWDRLLSEAQLGSTSLILDLGCGPGTATLPLARRVRQVTAIDAEQEMLDEGQRTAAAAGIGNVRWVHSAAETFQGDADAYDAAVIASAFHWIDRTTVTAKCHDLLVPGGLLAVVANPTPLMQLRRHEGVGAAIAEVQRRWFGDDFFPLHTEALTSPDDVLRASPFSSVEVLTVPCTQQWEVDRFIGFLRSTSSRPDQRLGDRFTTFAHEIDEAVRAIRPTGRWSFDSSVKITLARKTNSSRATTSA
jgi:SAM-dependent methyltransferase